MDAEIDVGEVPETVDGKAYAWVSARVRARANLADDENAAEELLARTRTAAAAPLRDSAGSMREANQAGSETGENARQGGCRQSEEQDGNVEAQVGLCWQRVEGMAATSLSSRA